MSKTYVIDVDRNTTTVLPAPPASAGFATNPAGLMGRLRASPSALVYLSPGNELHYIGVDQNNMAGSAANPWALISSSELVAAAAADPVSSVAASVTGSLTATASGGMSRLGLRVDPLLERRLRRVRAARRLRTERWVRGLGWVLASL